MGIGSLAVIVLMISSYGRFGVYATAALVFMLWPSRRTVPAAE